MFELITQLSSARGFAKRVDKLHGVRRAFRPIVLLLAVVFSVNAFAKRDDPKTVDAYGVSPIDVSIFPPLNLIHFEKTKIVGASLGLLASNADAVQGLSLNGLGGYHADEMRGVMLSGFMNFTGKTTGVLLSGLGNFAHSCPGVVMGSLFGNACGDDGSRVWPRDGFGVQLAGFKNVVYGNFSGIQFSFLENAVLGDGAVLQVGGLNSGHATIVSATPSGLTTTYKVLGTSRLDARLRGIQLGLVNSVTQNFSGIQLGLLVNSVGREMRGIQIGLWNSAGSLRGLQIGLINTADAGGVPFMPFVNAGF